MGNVLGAGLGQNVAQMSIHAGLPEFTSLYH